MSLSQQVKDMKLKSYLESERKYDFPDYMRLIRKGLGFSRQQVGDILGCSVTKIYYLEKGSYGNRGPEHEFIISLAEFYGLEGFFILNKFKKFMKDPKRVRREKDE